MKEFLTYEEFGAIGDGVHDDMEALCKTHEKANELSLPVKAKDGATYYIGKRDLTIQIRTDTDFGTAKFIIDDRELEKITSGIICIASDAEYFPVEIKSLKKNQKKIDFPHEGRVYVRVANSERKVYIRKGLNQGSGGSATDVFTVDNDGNIECPITLDYDTITSASAKSVDDKPITVRGGIFTTIANQCPSKYTYHGRNINISRSNVTIADLQHYVEGELDHGAPYSGFINVRDCYNFVLKDVVLTPHKTYYTESQIPGKMVGMGSYDLSATSTINALFKNVKQSIDVTNGSYWGLMGSNFCKNLMLEDCVISRFDAHCGVTGGYIKNCDLGFAGINLTGFEDFLIEDSISRCGVFFRLRDDYGSFFDGKLTIRNCTWYPTKDSYIMFTANNSGDHYFGYECMLPEIDIDGLTIEDEVIPEDKDVYLLPVYDKEFAPGKPFAYKLPEKITIKNIKTKTGRKLKLCANEELYAGTKIILD